MSHVRAHERKISHSSLRNGVQTRVDAALYDQLGVPALLHHCRGAVIVAHNAAFDRRFLPFLAAHPSACSYRLAAKVVPEAPNHKNQTLRAFFGVRDPALTGRRSHRALADVIVTRHVFFHCVDRYVAQGNDDRIEALFDYLLPKYQRAKSA